MPLHKPYVDDGSGGWMPQRLNRELRTVSDVVKALSTAEAKADGLLAEEFHEQGWISLEGVAIDLRARGYEVSVYRDGDEDERIKLLATPAKGAKERKKDQMTLVPEEKRSGLDN